MPDRADTFTLPVYDVRLYKATGKDGKERLRFSGIISTDAPDLDGEVVDQDGLDLSYFRKRGLFRWKHTPRPDEAPDDPKAYVGKPVQIVRVKLAGGYHGTRVEGEFFDTDLARDIYAQQAAMVAAGRSLGFSVEGKTLARDPKNPKRIAKSWVSNVAIDPHPINPLSSMDAIEKALKLGGKPCLSKADDDDPPDETDAPWPPDDADDADDDRDDADDELREGLDAGNASALVPESITGTPHKRRGSRMDGPRGRKAKMTKDEIRAALADLDDNDRAEVLGEFGGSGGSDDLHKALDANDTAFEALAKAFGVPRYDLANGAASISEGVDDLRKALDKRLDMDSAIAEAMIAHTGMFHALSAEVLDLRKAIEPLRDPAAGLEAIAKALRLPGRAQGATSVDDLRVVPPPAAQGGGEALNKAMASSLLLTAQRRAHAAGNKAAVETLAQAVAEVSNLRGNATVPKADVDAVIAAAGV